ncbi:competence type IV pilus assembly protein ComGB [Vagococcus allomyrinae]|uniref:competence type IV pilus assembly protein ComGB n=1 Tax=Vagococcus allomyrinae TaxID=2794353 RepID=UPI003221EEE5
MFRRKRSKESLRKKLKLSSQRKRDFVLLLGDLLVNGFTLQESLRFMKQLIPREQPAIELIEQHLAQGNLFYQCFQDLNFASTYVTQLRLSEVHGDLSGTLIQIGRQLSDRDQQRKQASKVLAYPLMLLVFLAAVMLLMKWLLLPQLGTYSDQEATTNVGFLVIEYGPMSLLGVLVIGGLLCVLTRGYFKGKPAIRQSRFLMKIPLVGVFLRYYYTSFFAGELGKLLNLGLEMKQILTIMKGEDSTKLMGEVAEYLSLELEQGNGIHVQIGKWSFFQKELSGIIQQGEAKGKLGDELIIYSNRLWRQLSQKVERLLTWLQPLIFVFVAVLIVAVYGALLLPIYQEMGEIL